MHARARTYTHNETRARENRGLRKKREHMCFISCYGDDEKDGNRNNVNCFDIRKLSKRIRFMKLLNTEKTAKKCLILPNDETLMKIFRNGMILKIKSIISDRENDGN